MATLKELVDEHGFGVKFTDSEGYWFIPYYEFEDFYYGISKRKANDYFCHIPQDWQLYVEPKKKVKVFTYFDSALSSVVLSNNSELDTKELSLLMCDGKPVYIEVQE